MSDPFSSLIVHHVLNSPEMLKLYYSILRTARRRVLSRRRRRKLANRRHRWFVDNIIMHHKRIHDKNRELVINRTRSLVFARPKQKEIGLVSARRWRDKDDIKRNLKTRASEIRGRIDARRIRIRSRWVSQLSR